MKTKIFAFLATVGVARGIIISILIAVVSFWTSSATFVLTEMSIKTFVIFSSMILIVFGIVTKIIIDILSWRPEAIKPKEKLHKNLDIAVTLGLVGLAGIIFLIHYEEVSTLKTVVFGTTALCTIYLYHKNGLFGSRKFFLILLITLIIFIIHTLIVQYYFGRHDEMGSGKIMLVGFYVGLIALTKIPGKFYQFWSKLKIKQPKVTAKEKGKDDGISIFNNISLFDLGNMYIYFSESPSENEELSKKQKGLYLEAFLSEVKSGKRMNDANIEYLCRRIAYTKAKLSSEFLSAVADQCLLNNLSYLALITSGPLSVNEWPILFKVSNKKALLVSSYLESLAQEPYDSMFNQSTHVFNVNAFTGLVNCLGHFYKKSDNDLDKYIAKQEVRKLFIFATDCCEKINFMEPSRYALRKRMLEIKGKFWELGLE